MIISLKILNQSTTDANINLTIFFLQISDIDLIFGIEKTDGIDKNESTSRAFNLEGTFEFFCFFLLFHITVFRDTANIHKNTTKILLILLKNISSRKICLVLGLLGTSEKTSSSGGDKTNLLTGNSVSRNGRSLTNVLMVTTTMRMVNGIHSNTTSSGP